MLLPPGELMSYHLQEPLPSRLGPREAAPINRQLVFPAAARHSVAGDTGCAKHPTSGKILWNLEYYTGSIRKSAHVQKDATSIIKTCGEISEIESTAVAARKCHCLWSSLLLRRRGTKCFLMLYSSTAHGLSPCCLLGSSVTVTPA